MSRLSMIAVIAGLCLVGHTAESQTIQTYAGGGFCGDSFGATQGMEPTAVAIDPSGNVFITDTFFSVVCRIDAISGKVTAIAGTGHGGYSGDGGAGTSAQLFDPNGLAIDASGDIYVLDNGNDVVREINAATGVITTVAGNGVQGYSGDGGPATSAELNFPQAIAFDSAGNLYISDTNNYRVREVSAATGIISTIAGNGLPNPPNKGQSYGDGGPATAAFINGATGLTFDSAGNLYIAEENRGSVRQVNAATGIINSVVGTGRNGYSGDGGPATSAQLSQPLGLAFDAMGDLFIGDQGNGAVREVFAANGTIATVVGSGVTGYSGDGGPAAAATLNEPTGVAFDPAGDLYIADTQNFRLRAVSATTGIITTVGGNGEAAYGGDGGPALAAEISIGNEPALDGAGNLYFGDGINRVRKVNAATGVISTVAGNGVTGYSGDGGAATSAALNLPMGVAVDAAGDLYIADFSNNRVREVSGSSGLITTVAGNGTGGYSGDGGAATSAQLFFPDGVALDGLGNLYISDHQNARVRQVNLSTGIITTVATVVSAGDPNAGQLAVDHSGNLYIADDGSEIRELNVQNGTFTTVAGNGTYGYSGDGGLATAAQLGYPYGLAFDPAGNLYFADGNNDVIREVNAATGIITTVAGNGTYGYSGDGGPPTSAEFSGPSGVVADASGDLFIADQGNHLIRSVTGAGTQYAPPTIMPSVTGTPGSNGWYVSNVQVSWTVNGNGTSITSQSGCGSITISTDTAGQVVTCSATNAGGTTTQSVTVKRDTTAPVITISTPANGATYPQGMVVNASYNCSDATSGVASCTGTTASGAPINTSTMGSMTFAVSATDQSGNTASASNSYTVTAPIVSYSLAPASVAFGSEAVNVASAAMSVTLTNTGTTALSITSITLAGSNPGQFSQTNNCGSAVAQSASCVIGVVFLPTSTGAKSATLNVVAGSAGTRHSVALTGTGADAGFSLSPASLSFGNQEIMVASPVQTVTLTNTGPVPLPVSGIAFTGGAAAQFSQNSTCGATVPVGGNCAISVTFVPVSVGSKSATLKVTAGGGAAAQSVSLSGTGTDPTYTLAPSSLAFGNQQVNVTSAARSVTLTNTSAVALPVGSIGLAGSNAGQFAQSNTCGASIPATSGCSISVTFLPTSTGAKAATLNVNLGNGAGAQSVNLSGTGVVPTYTLEPASIAFGNQAHGTNSAPATITLTNTSTLALPITSIAFSGGNSGQFAQTNTCGSSVAAGANCTISVSFEPSSKGAKSSSLKVTAGAGAGNQTTTLTGNGT